MTTTLPPPADPPPDDPSPVNSPVEAPRPIRQRVTEIAREWGTTLLLFLVAFVVIGKLRAPDLGERPPALDLATLTGEPFHLSEQTGRTVVLNFWATWCGPCRVEIPQLNAFAETHPDIIVLGVAMDGTEPELKAAVKSLNIAYPVARADAATIEAWQVSTLPTTIVVGADGGINGAHTGIITSPQLWWMTRG